MDKSVSIYIDNQTVFNGVISYDGIDGSEKKSSGNDEHV